MSFSSKKIIRYIKSSKSSITAVNIAEELLASKRSTSSRSGKKQKKNKVKKKKKVNLEAGTIKKVKIILDGLASIGYLTKNRRKYKITDNFGLEGILKVNTSGNGVIITSGNDEIIIFKENLNKARNNDLVSAEIIDFRDNLYWGKVIKIIERRKQKYLAKVTGKSAKHTFLKLLDMPGENEVCCLNSNNNLSENDYAIIQLTKKYVNGKPKCEIKEYDISEEEFDVKRIILRHNLPEEHQKYKELLNIESKIPKKELKNRKDYRDLFTITIDGDNSKDFDDAVSLELYEKKYKLYIHIADVSAYVRKNSPLDKEAKKRGTSFYLGNHVIPMLPELLSNNICSLKENEDRFTLTAEIVFNNRGKEISSSFHRGIIRSNKRLTYKIAESIINKKGKKEIDLLLKNMYNLAEILKKRRLKNGRIDLNLQDYELIYEKDNFKEIGFAVRLKSHMIIEEFMLSANEVVSRALTESNIPALYRIHEQISDDKILSLRKFIKTLGYRLDNRGRIGVSLQKVIDEVKGKKYEQVINFIILRSFMQAYYGINPLGHFGLGFADYTHFTSPIRRYPDLIVHRCIKSIIDKSKPPYDDATLEIIGESSSEMERTAQVAERDLFKLISCQYMEDKVGRTFDVVISGISKFGFFVALLDKPIEGMVPLKYLTDDYYLVMEDEYTVVGRRLKKRYRLGDTLKVELKEVSFEFIRIDFIPV